VKHLKNIHSESIAILDKVEKCDLVVTDVGRFRCFLLFGLEAKSCAKWIQVCLFFFEVSFGEKKTIFVSCRCFTIHRSAQFTIRREIVCFDRSMLSVFWFQFWVRKIVVCCCVCPCSFFEIETVESLRLLFEPNKGLDFEDLLVAKTSEKPVQEKTILAFSTSISTPDQVQVISNQHFLGFLLFVRSKRGK
jgi:hypothetical protein